MPREDSNDRASARNVNKVGLRCRGRRRCRNWRRRTKTRRDRTGDLASKNVAERPAHSDCNGGDAHLGTYASPTPARSDLPQTLRRGLCDVGL